MELVKEYCNVCKTQKSLKARITKTRYKYMCCSLHFVQYADAWYELLKNFVEVYSYFLFPGQKPSKTEKKFSFLSLRMKMCITLIFALKKKFTDLVRVYLKGNKYSRLSLSQNRSDHNSDFEKTVVWDERSSNKKHNM